MPCYGPLTAYYAKDRNPSGLRSLVFDKRNSHSGVKVMVPCGQCIGCRLEWSRSWASRLMHEKRMHADSAFLTLTYSDKTLPEAGTLVKRDLQLFMKRLRKVRPEGLRFFGCGEYGETTQRAHYHVLLLNSCFPDMKFYGNARSGEPLYVSAELNGIWQKGECKVGQVTFESCAYVARYVTKKITGPPAEAHYAGRLPEFHVMSRRPGIGMDYFVAHGREMYQHDSIIVRGHECRVPRYYDTKWNIVDPQHLEMLKRVRRRRAKLHREDQTSARRKVIERFEYLKAETFKRNVV